MKRITGVLLLVVLYTSWLTSKQMAITLDDLPFAYSRGLSEQERFDYFYRILDILDCYGFQSAGFVVGEQVSSRRYQCLLDFYNRGHIIANHTFSHPDLNNLSASDFIEDIVKCDQVIEELYGEVKYFRYPMLHRGNSMEKRDSVYDFLNRQGFIIAPASIDNDEYAFNQAYLDKLTHGDTAAADSIGQEYLAYMISISNHYDSLAWEITGREINHILLLHMNYLNSVYLDDLIKLLLEDGWVFVSFSEAIQDSVYLLPDNYVGSRGISWLERIQ